MISRPKRKGYSFHAARRQADVDAAAAASKPAPRAAKPKLSRAQQRALGNKRRGERLSAIASLLKGDDT